MKNVILITGGSRGLGAKFVERLASTGENLIYFTYSNSYTESMELVSKFEGVKAIKCEQRDEEQIKNCISKIVSECGRVDVLVNNACSTFKPLNFIDTEWTKFQDLLDVNVKGSFYFMRETAKIMKEQGRGKIINILSSYVLSIPPEKIPFYITAKHALLGLSKSAAAELVKFGITFNMISPSLMATDLSSYLPKKYLELYSQKHPMKKMVSTEDVADALEFLISNKSQFMNGVNLPVNGGEAFLC